MPTIRFSRPFSSGSRPTPDPFDKFLDSYGFYRKHTARDSSSLFRVISEQVYDTQDHHEQVRKDCVNYMIKHREQYEELVPDFNQYVRQMAKAETYGTLTELRAMGYLFKRNILLYRPFDLGVKFVDDADYKEPVVRVFHASHFDSIYEKSYIIDAAFCQSIAYEMLYKKVYKLPDIEYSVETMLHSDINHEPSKHEYENGDEYATHIAFDDGRKFQLDRPENTLCILSDPERCHFHNKDFEESLKRDTRRFEKSTLSDKYNSCVRQLLFDGITPFPYKVAKALDENIYRNVEFDSWNEVRKLSKPKPNGYKVGVECMVKLSEAHDEWLKCRIQAKETDESYIVFIDKLSEKRSVPCSSMRPVSVAQRDHVTSRTKSLCMKESIDEIGYNSRNVQSHPKSHKFDDLNIDYDAICKSFDLESYINLSNFNFPQNNQHELIAYPLVYSHSTNMSANNNLNSNSNNGTKSMKNRNHNQQNHGNALSDSNEKQQQQQQQTPKVDDEHSYGKNVHESKQDSQQTTNSTTTYYQQQSHDQNADTVLPVNQAQTPNYYHQGSAPIYYCPTADYNDQNLYPADMIMPHSMYALPAPPMQPNMYAPISGNQAAHYPMHVGGWSPYNAPMNPQGYVFSGPPTYAMPAVSAPLPFQLPFLSRDLLRSNGRINFTSNYAYSSNGDDLPLNDKVSLRFYYNLGVEYYKLLHHVYGNGALMAMIDGDSYDPPPSSDGDSQHVISDLQQMNLESNEIEVPSPIKVFHPRSYDSGYRRAPNPKYNKRNDNRSVGGKQFQGTYQGPTKSFNKTNQKYANNQSGNGFENTPLKENTGKSYQHGHAMSKREQTMIDNDNSNGNMGFGSNVPPFPYYDANEQHYGPPGNAVFTRMTPPTSARPSSVPAVPYHPNHGFSQCWLPNVHPGSVQQQQQQQQPPPQPLQHQSQSQSHSLNTSAASNPSQ